jgi:hypothetical protein
VQLYCPLALYPNKQQDKHEQWRLGGLSPFWRLLSAKCKELKAQGKGSKPRIILPSWRTHISWEPVCILVTWKVCLHFSGLTAVSLPLTSTRCTDPVFKTPKLSIDWKLTYLISGPLPCHFITYCSPYPCWIKSWLPYTSFGLKKKHISYQINSKS